MEIKRDKYLNDLIVRMNNGLVKVITGIRRCGKYKLREEEFGNGGYGQVILAEKKEEKKGEKRLYFVTLNV